MSQQTLMFVRSWRANPNKTFNTITIITIKTKYYGNKESLSVYSCEDV